MSTSVTAKAFADGDCECDKNEDVVCCESLTAECAACKFDMSVDDFCKINSKFSGCLSETNTIDNDTIDMQRVENKIHETLQNIKDIEKQQNDDIQRKNLIKYKMARSCGPDYNLNKVTNYNKFECRYLGVGELENGKKVRNPFQTWKGTLPSCDDSIVISDELMDDVKFVAYDAASGDDAKLNVDEFLCNITSLPIN